jgi:hypothetical protein
MVILTRSALSLPPFPSTFAQHSLIELRYAESMLSLANYSSLSTGRSGTTLSMSATLRRKLPRSAAALSSWT